jgi:hypothetical protein
MKKTQEDKREERIEEILKLYKQRDAINARLNLLTGIVDGTNTKADSKEVPPVGFSYSKEVENLFMEHPQLRILQATALLQKKFPYQIERRKVHSALVYLVERGKIVKEKEERGLFSRKAQTSP